MNVVCPFCRKDIDSETTECPSCGHVYDSETLRFFVAAGEELSHEYPDERREHIRVPQEFKVSYSTPEAFGEDYLFNLSTGGLFIRADSPLDEGEEVRLKVHLPDEEDAMEVLGKVIWSRAEEEMTQEGKQPPGVGVEFLDLSKEDIERIISVLSKTLA
jgi:uncharacterized protein (TIGR02266 family)